MDEILKIIFRRNKQRKLLTNSDVREICNIVFNYGFLPYTRQVHFKNIYKDEKGNDDITCQGITDGYDVTFYKVGVEYSVESLYNNVINNHLVECCKTDLYNYFYLCIIFHELAHFRQHYLVDWYPKKLESQLYSMIYDVRDIKDFYESSYHNLLTEVNANNMASTRATRIYEQLPKEFFSDKDRLVLHTIMLNSLLRDNYEVVLSSDKIISPAERLYIDMSNEEKIDEKKYYKLITTPYDLTLYHKIMYGLPISYGEYAYANVICEALYSKKDVDVLKKLQKKIQL